MIRTRRQEREWAVLKQLIPPDIFCKLCEYDMVVNEWATILDVWIKELQQNIDLPYIILHECKMGLWGTCQNDDIFID